MPRTKQFDQEAVLDRAIELFWEKGYHATSYRDLVSYMGINRASMYDTYGDKHQLYVKAIERYREKKLARLERQLAQFPTFREKVNGLMEKIIEESSGDLGARGCFLVNTTTELAASDEDILWLVEKNRLDFEAVFIDLILDAQAQQEISLRHNPKSLAQFMFNSINGLRVMARTNPDRSVLENIRTITLSVLDQ